MRRATVLITSLLLAAVPAVAHAKAGVEFQTNPDTAKPGQKISFTVMAVEEPPQSGGDLRPIVGAYPLVTFRSDSGQVVRVRAGRTDRNGLAQGSVALPAKGRWTTELHVGSLEMGPDLSEPFQLDAALTHTTPAAGGTRTKPVAADGGGFPWLWVLSLGSIGSALLVLTMRRRGHWGAA